MKLNTLELVVQTLNESQVRYMIAGGLAVNAHGYLRMSLDIDMVVALDADNIKRAFVALQQLGYHPLVPVTSEQFADPSQRQRWIEEKGMQVLNFVSDQHRETPIDVFVYEPFDFDTEWQESLQGEIQPGLAARFVSIPMLIQMKEATGRAKDMDDVQHLRWIQEERLGNA